MLTLNSKRKLLVTSFTVLAILVAGAVTAQAQQKPDSKSVKTTLGLEGYCPVCITQMKKWVKGTEEHQATYNGKTYWFPGEKQKNIFLANPQKYIPALNGDCAVCLAKMGRRVPGNIRHGAFHEGRLFLFPAEMQKKAFLANPGAFVNRETKTDDVKIEGRSGCAACDHGVVPVGSPDVMGLAITAGDGNVYVVEDAHKLYPDVYKQRFQGLRLAVSGTELKRNGKIIWITPSHLEVLN